MIRIVYSGPAASLSDFRESLAGAVAGRPVALSASRKGAGADEYLYDADSVVVSERIAEAYGHGPEGGPWSMDWTFTGTGARTGALVRVAASSRERELSSFTVEVTEAEADAVRAALAELKRHSA